MTMGVPFLYSECRNGFPQKGTCHVNQSICFSKSIPDPSRAKRAYHRADHHLGDRRNDWFRLDADRPDDRASGFKDTELALERLRLPLPSLG